MKKENKTLTQNKNLNKDKIRNNKSNDKNKKETQEQGFPQTILLSIKPEFVDKIISGEKRYEYRKILPKKNVDRVVVYSCKPVGKVVGEFKVKRTLSLSPDELWEMTKDYSGISEEFYREYFKVNKEAGNRDKDKIRANAFEIKEFIKYEEVKELDDFEILNKGLKNKSLEDKDETKIKIKIKIYPPQSFYYIKIKN